MNWLLTGEVLSDRLLKELDRSFDREEISLIKETIVNLIKLNNEQIKAVLALIKLINRKK